MHPLYNLQAYRPIHETYECTHITSAITSITKSFLRLMCESVDARFEVVNGVLAYPIWGSFRTLNLLPNTNMRIRRALISMLKVDHGRIEFYWQSAFAGPTSQVFRGCMLEVQYHSSYSSYRYNTFFVCIVQSILEESVKWPSVNSIKIPIGNNYFQHLQISPFEGLLFAI